MGAAISKFIQISILYFIPVFVITGLSYMLDIKSFIDTSNRQLEASLTTAWVGYSFAAAFFLIALPRNSYTTMLQKKGLLNRFSLIILSPAIFGSFHMLSIIFLKQATSSCLENFSIYLFYLTVGYALYSMFILGRILQLHNRVNSKK